MKGKQLKSIIKEAINSLKNQKLNEQNESGQNITDINFTNSTNCSGQQFMPSQGGSSNNLAGALNSGTWYQGMIQYTNENNLNFTDIAFAAGSQNMFDTDAANACIPGLAFANQVNMSGTGGSTWRFTEPFKLSFIDINAVPGYVFPHAIVNSWEDIVNALTGQTPVQYVNSYSIPIPLGGEVEGYLSGFPLSVSEVGNPSDFVANLIYGGVLPQGQRVDLMQRGVEECNCPAPTENFDVDCYSEQYTLNSDIQGDGNSSPFYYTTVGIQNLLQSPLNTYLTPEWLNGECPNGAVDTSNFAYMDLFGSTFQNTPDQFYCVCYNEIMDLLQGINRHSCGVGGVCTPDEEGPFLSLEDCAASGCAAVQDGELISDPEDLDCTNFNSSLFSNADRTIICYACSQGNIPSQLAQLCGCCPSQPDVDLVAAKPPMDDKRMKMSLDALVKKVERMKKGDMMPKKPTNVSPVKMAPQQKRMMREQVERMQKLAGIKNKK